jgi:hypothetical protein
VENHAILAPDLKMNNFKVLHGFMFRTTEKEFTIWEYVRASNSRCGGKDPGMCISDNVSNHPLQPQALDLARHGALADREQHGDLSERTPGLVEAGELKIRAEWKLGKLLEGTVRLRRRAPPSRRCLGPLMANP